MQENIIAHNSAYATDQKKETYFKFVKFPTGLQIKEDIVWTYRSAANTTQNAEINEIFIPKIFINQLQINSNSLIDSEQFIFLRSLSQSLNTSITFLQDNSRNNYQQQTCRRKYQKPVQYDSPTNFTMFVTIMLIFRTSNEKIPALLNLFLREYAESQIIYVKETQQSLRQIKEKNKAKKKSLSSKIAVYPKSAREIIDKPIVKQATGNIEKKSAHNEAKICVKNEVLNSAVRLRILQDLYMQYLMQKKAIYQARQRQNIAIEHEMRICSLFLCFIQFISSIIHFSNKGQNKNNFSLLLNFYYLMSTWMLFIFEF
ncbi:transmembrane protein, putative (macronuclear) [Tetrahymena thermophila SB210]|uniref:Transmembrane protein, putative n=1 Tax=Tetrahymena thermophila (strain SB210) TaxID=312017 RepID=W7XKE7_TETTS|nr:transmembrane protein, putative [Tetrahymena thermophila SB210]EWS74834.1 transmembrane protein, putative [Tetrahymena thermophila SB210]|eukprot:XP_012652547.1 transmembrane protein, putative [Tetrahymena thermophila SB210]